MTGTDDARSHSAAIRFLERFLADRAAGQVRSLADYQGLFPNARDVVATEYARITNADRPALAAEHGPLTHPAQGDRYRAPKTIGRGGMGTVLRVFDPALQREVAMKRLGDEQGKLPHPDQLARFLDEAQVTGQLQHPGIVSVFEIGLDAEQRPYFTMPLIDGRSLHEILSELHAGAEDWPLVRVVDVLVRVCEAVAYAHERNIVHRDLKPANVMIGRFGETYVVDWGLARCTDKPDRRDIRIHAEADGAELDSSLRTMEGDVIGTPAYMAPEQARGEIEAVGVRSDVYSLGAMLYHLLAGTPPYVDPGKEPSGRATLQRVLAGPPRALAGLSPAPPPELVAICTRAMARDADERYASAAELARELRAFRENRVVTAYATGPIAELIKWFRRNRAVAVASLLAVASLAGGFAWSEVQRLRAEENARRATQEADRANTNADLAAENLDLAFAAGNELLGKFVLQGLGDAAGSDPVRRAILERGLEYYERLRDLRGADRRVDSYIARAHFRVAELLTELGRKDEAVAAWSVAHAAMEQVIARHGETPDLRHRRLKIRGERHVIELQEGKVEAAIAGLERVVEDLAELRRQFPDVTAYLRTECGFHFNLALAMFDARKEDGALRYSAATLETAREIARREVQVPAAQSLLGSALTLRGRLMWQLQRLADAETCYEEGTAVLEAALNEHPGSRALLIRLGELLNLRAILCRTQQDPAGATAMFERTVAIYRQLVAAYPGVRNFHGGFGGALVNLGIMKSLAEDRTAAVQLFDEGLVHVRHALEIDETARDFRLYRRIVGRELAIAHAYLGQHAAAAHAVREWLAELPETPPVDGARMFAVCAKVGDADEDLDPADRERLTAGYGDEAMQLLERAAADGQLHRSDLESSAYDAMRKRPDFVALLAELDG